MHLPVWGRRGAVRRTITPSFGHPWFRAVRPVVHCGRVRFAPASNKSHAWETLGCLRTGFGPRTCRSRERCLVDAENLQRGYLLFLICGSGIALPPPNSGLAWPSAAHPQTIAGDPFTPCPSHGPRRPGDSSLD